MERSRPSTTVRRDDPGEFRVGRLKHERVKVPRGDAMMEWAESVMQIHADRKSVLEVRGQLKRVLTVGVQEQQHPGASLNLNHFKF